MASHGHEMYSSWFWGMHVCSSLQVQSTLRSVSGTLRFVSLKTNFFLYIGPLYWCEVWLDFTSLQTRMFLRSCVWTAVRLNLGCIAFLPKSYLNQNISTFSLNITDNCDVFNVSVSVGYLHLCRKKKYIEFIILSVLLSCCIELFLCSTVMQLIDNVQHLWFSTSFFFPWDMAMVSSV